MEALDAVHVVTTEGAHREPALAALARGKHVFVEKPLATNVEDCVLMIEAARRAAQRFAYPPSQFRFARWQALNGDAAGARHTLKLLCAMHAPRHCREVAEAWTAAQATQPALRAVTAPTRPH